MTILYEAEIANGLSPIAQDEIQQLIENFSVKIEGNVISPASDELFVQIPGDKELCKERSEEFHSVTQKLLFIIRRGRPELETATRRR